MNMVHVNCGGIVVEDADCIPGDGDVNEIWWNYRCFKCREIFRDAGEWLAEEEG